MRLIDVDALIEAVEDLYEYAELDEVLDVIKIAPTVEPFESIGAICNENCGGYRPHGEWIEKVETKQLGHGWLTTHEIVCSVCGGSGENDENIPQCWKFCPNCGRRMKGIKV